MLVGPNGFGGPQKDGAQRRACLGRSPLHPGVTGTACDESLPGDRPQNYRWQNRKEYDGKMNSAQYALARLFWLLYWAGSTHRPHMYPTPGRAWVMGVVGGCARAVPALPPPPWLNSAKKFFIAAILLWENDDVGIVLFYSVIYNSVGLPHFPFLNGVVESLFNVTVYLRIKDCSGMNI